MFDIDTIMDSAGLYQTTLPSGHKLTWRLLTIKEQRAFASLLRSGAVSELILYDRIFDRCYIGNALLIDGEMPFGWCLSIGRAIFELSGDQGSIQDDLELHRSLNPPDGLEAVMQRVILRAFPAYTFEDLEQWTRPVFLQRFVIAEYILAESAHPYAPIEMKNILTPEQKAKAEARRKNQGPIDFDRENAQLEKATGTANGGDIWDLPPEEFARRQKIARHMHRHRQ